MSVSMAAICLGRCVKFMNNEIFPRELRRYAFIAATSAFLRQFPANYHTVLEMEYESKKSITMQTFQCRIYMIGAISHFFGIPEANNSLFANYIDQLFVVMLHPRTSPLLQAAILDAISSNLPRTNGNRARISKYYKPCVEHLESTGTADADSKKKKVAIGILKSSICRFWSFWYPLMDDQEVLLLNSSDATIIGEYASNKRFLLLENGMQISKSPYPVDHPTFAGHSAFEAFSDECLSRNNLDTCKFCASTSDSVLLKDSMVAEEPRFTVQLDSMEIKFSSWSQCVTFFVRNDSLSMQSSFFIQITEPDYFEISPSYSKLAPGESVKVEAKMKRPLSGSRSVPMVSGLLIVRSRNGVPKEKYAKLT